MKVLVTGGTGFIGRHLVEELLDKDYEVLCITRKPVEKDFFSKSIENIVCDLQEIDKPEMEKAMENIDIVIHLAAQLGHYGIPYEYYESVNYRATVALARMSVRQGVKQFILCSTPLVTGLEGRYTKEDAPYAPTNEYSKTKALAEKGVIKVCGGKIPYTIFRPNFVYGAGDVRRTALYRSIKKKMFVLTTSGKSYLQPTYVSDIVDGFMLSILNENAYNEIFNLGYKRDYTSLEYLKCIADHVGAPLLHMNISYFLSVFLADIVDFISRKLLHKAGFVNKGRIDFLSKNHSCDIGKAQKLLGYRPRVDLDEGIRLSVEWAERKGYL